MLQGIRTCESSGRFMSVWSGGLLLPSYLEAEIEAHVAVRRIAQSLICMQIRTEFVARALVRSDLA